MIEKVFAGFKKILADFDLVDAGEVDENLNPVGSTAIKIESVMPINPAISDAVLTISFMGMTTADADPDKSIITKLYDNMRKALAELTAADIASACGVQAELWYNLSNTPPSAGAERYFMINYNLTVQNFQQ